MAIHGKLWTIFTLFIILCCDNTICCFPGNTVVISDLEQLPGLSREGKSLDEETTTISEVDSNENEGEYEDDDEEQYDIDDFEYQTTSDGLFLDYFRVL